MVGWIKMPLGRELGLGPGDIVLYGDPAPKKRGTAANFRPMSIAAKLSSILYCCEFVTLIWLCMLLLCCDVIVYTVSTLFFMVTLWNREYLGIFLPCGFFFCFLLLSFFPRLISAVADWMSAILPYMVWP